jgi:hypothetical protein
MLLVPAGLIHCVKEELWARLVIAAGIKVAWPLSFPEQWRQTAEATIETSI